MDGINKKQIKESCRRNKNTSKQKIIRFSLYRTNWKEVVGNWLKARLHFSSCLGGLNTIV
jgi:hypothetical protein